MLYVVLRQTKDEEAKPGIYRNSSYKSDTYDELREVRATRVFIDAVTCRFSAHVGYRGLVKHPIIVHALTIGSVLKTHK